MSQKISRVFGLSGFKSDFNAADSKTYMARLISELGGVFTDTEHLPPSCTHLICSIVSRTEKYLSASASGIWILSPEYVLNSHKHGGWLPEYPYEWNGQHLRPFYDARICDLIGESAKRNRTLVAETMTKRFGNWSCIIQLSSKKDQEVYERILEAGGATIYNLNEMKRLSPDALQNLYKFTELVHVEEMGRKFFNRQHQNYLSIDFIRNFLLREVEPRASDFYLAYYATREDPLAAMLCRLSNPVLPGSRLFLELERLKFSDLTVEQKKQLKAEARAGEPPMKMRKKSRRKKKIRTREEMIMQNSLSEASYATEVDRELKRSNSVKRYQNVLNKWSSSRAVTRRKLELWSTPYRVKTDNIKAGSEADSVKVKVLPAPLANMFTFSMEEGSPENAIGFLYSTLSPAWYPPPAILATLISSYFAEENYKANGALDVITRNHHPTTKELAQTYLEAFSIESRNKVQPWLLFSKLFRKCISESHKESQTLSSMLVQVVKENFTFFLSKTVDPKKELTDKDKRPLVVHLFWPDGKVGSLSKNCQELFSLLSQQLKEDEHYDTMTSVRELLCMVVECVRLSNVSSPRQREVSINDSICQKFAFEVIKACQTIFRDTQLKTKFLGNVQPAWFQMIISEMLLQNIPNIGFSSSAMNEPLSLNKIISHYMEPDAVRSPRKINPKLCSALMHIPELQKAAQSQKDPLSVNYANKKGETPVHRACMKNSIPKLKKLLCTPGVEVDIKDYAGWTPLHEACNKGNIDCVKMLLQWKPHPTCRTQEDENKVCFVDLTAPSTDEYITPLHDAVNNNHVEVARLLLQYGGKTLLDLKDKKGRRPLDMVRSVSMVTLLNSAQNIPRPASDSEENIYDELPSSQEDKAETEKVSSVTISLELCNEYLNYLGCLVNSYLTWNCIREINLVAKDFEITTELVSDLYATMFGFSPTSKEDIVRLRSDLQLAQELDNHLQLLECTLEKKTRKKKKEFHVQFLSLELKAQC